jgi:hypothetical protein
MTRPTFGIGTPPQQVGYEDVLRVWQEADAIPEIEHAGCAQWLAEEIIARL